MEDHEINYYDCANAVVKMWMEGIITDREQSELIRRLNEFYKGKEV